ILAQHPLAPRQHVLKGDVERMADVERARDVGRRHDDRPRLGVGAVRPEEPARLPMLVPALLDRGGVEGLWELGHRRSRLAMRRCSINRQAPPYERSSWRGGESYSPRSGCASCTAAVGSTSGTGAPCPSHWRSQSNTSWYHCTEFLGFSTQWFSSGKISSREGMFRRWSAVKAAIPCVYGIRKSCSLVTTSCGVRQFWT